MQSILKNQTMLIIVALVFGGIGGYVISPKIDPTPLYIQISDLEEENTFLDNQLEGLQVQHESTQNDLEEEKGQYENLQADFTNIENQLVDSQHQNELLENNNTEQANTIENLEEELDNLSDTVTEKRLEITQKTNEIDDLHEDISDARAKRELVVDELGNPVYYAVTVRERQPDGSIQDKIIYRKESRPKLEYRDILVPRDYRARAADVQ